MATFSATTASPFFLNCRAMTVSSGSDSIPSNCSVAPSAAVLTASLLPLVNSFIGIGAELDSVGRLPGRDFLLVVNCARAALQKMQVPIHRVLVERNEHVDLVTHVADRPVARREWSGKYDRRG